MIEPSHVADLVERFSRTGPSDRGKRAAISGGIKAAKLGGTKPHGVIQCKHLGLFFELEEKKMIATIGLGNGFKGPTDSAANVLRLCETSIHRGEKLDDIN